MDLLVVGAPTHAFSLSRPGTREEAVRQGAPAEHARTGIPEWLPLIDGEVERASEWGRELARDVAQRLFVGAADDLGRR